MSQYSDTRKVEDLDSKTLAKAVEIAHKLQAKIEIDGASGIPKNDLSKHTGILSKLLEYLILNQNNPNIDTSLIKFLEKVLGINRLKSKDKNKEQEKEELTEEQKKIRYQQIMYEAYKILNPHRIAGETGLENFIANVLTRGIEVAKEYEGAEYQRYFTRKELKDLESYKEGFVQKLKSSGYKGYGRGL